MCGRVFVKTDLETMLHDFVFAKRGEVDSLSNQFPRFNGAPGLDYPIIVMDVVREPDIQGPVFMRARWGFIPHVATSAKEGYRHVNARGETVATNGLFKHAYRNRRALMPIAGFFEWKDVHGTGKDKQPYAIAMKSGRPFCLAAIWQEWRDPATGDRHRTFLVLTCPANALMAPIHDRMPVILHPQDYRRWLSGEEDPADLIAPFPPELMVTWPVGRAVGNSKNESADLIDPIEPADGA